MILLGAIAIVSAALTGVVVDAHSDGAPDTACSSMTPGHQRTAMRDASTAVHRLQHQLNQNNQHIVTLEGKNGLPIAFKGFFVQARAVKSNGTSNPMGSWDVSGANGLAKGVSCGASADSAVTHTSNVNKTAPVSLVWTPPSLPPPASTDGGQVIFVATVVQSFDTYWVGIYSDAINLPTAAAVAATAAWTPSPTATARSAGVTPATANSAFGGNGAMTSNATIPPFKKGPGFSGKVNDRNLPGSSNPLGSARRESGPANLSASTSGTIMASVSITSLCFSLAALGFSLAAFQDI